MRCWIVVLTDFDRTKGRFTDKLKCGYGEFSLLAPPSWERILQRAHGNDRIHLFFLLSFILCERKSGENGCDPERDDSKASGSITGINVLGKTKILCIV